MKDVIILGIQQCRILTLVSPDFFNSVWDYSKTDEKSGITCGKSYFLCPGRAGISDNFNDFGVCQLFYRAESFTNQEKQRQ